jgi:capsular polysaccharide export protein
LEVILRETHFPEEVLRRAESLRERLTATGVTKYNVGSGIWKRPVEAARVILVPGQVESDASIAYGASEVRTNLDLLMAVRQDNPEAYVIYKPHPDVVAGLRKAGRADSDAGEYCDLELRDVAMSQLLEEIDEVHTMTSLTGFEALLRGKIVVTYGMPFYAGWGRTQDLGMLPEVAARRSRRLELKELIAGALIYYPTYVSRRTGMPSTPELALEELLKWRSESASPLGRMRILIRWVLSLRKY